MRVPVICLGALALALFVHPSAHAADGPRAIVDRVAVRFFSPETGGPTAPRFVTERILAFEGRLEAMTEERGGAADTSAPTQHHLEAALERHIVEEILATLDESSHGADAADASLAREARADAAERAGSESALYIAAEEEGLSAEEVDVVFTRRARAAAYVDRAMSRILHPQDDQLREVHRTTQSPFKNRPFDEVKLSLTRWFVFERLKALEATFLQTARSHVTIVVVPR
jgi:hypothetical protein